MADDVIIGKTGLIEGHEQVTMVGYVQLTVLLIVVIMASIGETSLPARTGATSDRRLVTNFGLGVIVMATGLLPWIGPMAAATLATERGWGLLQAGPLGGMALAAEGVLAIMLLSLVGYGIHRLMHRVDPLWRLHRLHHSDVQLDFSTGFRTHPLEAILSSVCLSAAVLLVGLSPLAVAAALIFVQAFDLLAHSNMALPSGIDRPLSLIFATPTVHARHHSTDRGEHDSNFGNGLIIWDRLFGTYSGREAPQRLGLD